MYHRHLTPPHGSYRYLSPCTAEFFPTSGKRDAGNHAVRRACKEREKTPNLMSNVGDLELRDRWRLTAVTLRCIVVD